MTYEEAIKILEVNVICSPKAIQFKEAVEAVTNEIKRQKTENERLQKERQLINEDLTNALTKMRALRENIKIAKSEAIKEFAERLKGYAKELKIGDNIYLQVVGIGRIDNLVKEMEGD